MRNKSDQSLSTEELERGEWYIERVLPLQTSSLVLTGLILGVADGWLLLPGGLVLPFLFWRAAQDRRPPITLLQRIGVRKRREITEQLAPKALSRLRRDSFRLRGR